MIEYSAPPIRCRQLMGVWYLKGFADAYGAHWAVAPSGPAGEDYLKGYALGLARVREEFFGALAELAPHWAAVPADSCWE